MSEPVERKRVLVVDDALATRLAVAESLQPGGAARQDGGYAIEAAASSEEALAVLEKGPCILVLADLALLGVQPAEWLQSTRQLAPRAQVFLMADYGNNQLAAAATQLGADGHVIKPFTLDHMREIVERAADHAEGSNDRAAPLPADVHAAPERSPDARFPLALPQVLEQLLADTGARCILLLTASGHSVEVAGRTRELHVPTLGALIAANFSAAAELSRQLGNQGDFRASHHDGAECSVYTYEAADDLLLAVVFGAQSKPGAVWLFAKRAAAELAYLAPTKNTPLPSAEGLASGIDAELSRLLEGSSA